MINKKCDINIYDVIFFCIKSFQQNNPDTALQKISFNNSNGVRNIDTSVLNLLTFNFPCGIVRKL